MLVDLRLAAAVTALACFVLQSHLWNNTSTLVDIQQRRIAIMEDEEPQPNATVYVRNLDESIKLPALIESLRSTFSVFGTIVDVIAKKSLKRRGQAFIVFDNADSAQMAIDELQGFELFDKQMHLAFAKTRSDATVKREDGDEAFEQHKAQRIAEKERKQAAEEKAKLQQAKHAAADALAERPVKTSKPSAGVVPEEYLPPNKVLLLRDLPEDYTKDNAMLKIVFGRFPGLKDIRLVPGRNMGFAEYEDKEGATQAKEKMDGQELAGSAIKVTYQRD
ncbi:small nuclear ribonucleoprotein U1a [Acrodontium crateriforme]|uniref:Small nuclear ribonucleoprotein U1a n=1 Tax=Acrodontium crateriforme TaxID=150365 RepID=A0AAQ3MBN5_9PEZI|nr:small nuclear ribonucleoprotein U1a [Acrodontium crateriforme]